MQQKGERTMKYFLVLATMLAALFATASAQTSPEETASGKIGSATLTIKYCAPSVRGRQIFGAGGRVMQDPTAPIWRAGANSATMFSTSTDLTIGGLAVPKGEYTLYVNVNNPDAWELVINKQTGQWGTEYDASKDLGRVKMEMTKPSALIEMLKYTISSKGGNQGTIELAWENHIATVSVTAK
jgi:opacity protein-like surface antigen